MLVLMKGRIRRFIRDRVVIGQITKLGRNGNGLSTAAAMIVFNHDFNTGQIFVHGGFEVSETDGLQAYVGVVEVLHRRLNEQDFQLGTDSLPSGKAGRGILWERCKAIYGRV